MNQNINYDGLKLADTLQFVSDCIRHSLMMASQNSCNDCGKVNCEYAPKIGQPVRINCPLWEDRQKTDPNIMRAQQ